MYYDGHKKMKKLEGTIRISAKGVGYVNTDPPAGGKGQSIEVDPNFLNTALNGDTVRILVHPETEEDKLTGEVEQVLERKKTEFVGTIQGDTLRPGSQGVTLVVPADTKFYRPIRLRTAGDAKEGDKVMVKLLSFTGKEDAEGELMSVIGKAGEHRVEMNAIVMEHGFATDFPPEVAREAKHLEQDHANIIAAEIPKRADYRNVTTFTIDPPDAKDFDDALSVRKLPSGEYEIGVHIADATFFVREGTPLGNEAQKRGTSVYLVDATIPMLPHELSAGVCSLKEGEDRLTFSAVFRMNKNAEVLERRFEKSVIHSNKRYTYEDAQKTLDTQDGPYLKELNILRDLARIMRTKRQSEGAIDFGDNEVKFELDPSGKPLRVVRKQRIETNLLIEDFMLLANVEVARYISHIAAKVPERGMVFLYRIHDTPKEDRIEELATFVRAVGYEFGKRNQKRYSNRDIRKLLKDIEGKPEEHLIRTATLRSMAKAIYSTKNIGHFGLSFEHYTHFTSPIRRYPDMLVHRILASHLNGKPITRREYAHLERLCIEASEAEAKAVDAERESIRYKQVEFMTGKIGQTFDAVISGVTDWGVYVEEKESRSEGMVRLASMKSDFFTYEPKKYRVKGNRTGKVYSLGGEVRIKLTRADMEERVLDFELV